MKETHRSTPREDLCCAVLCCVVLVNTSTDFCTMRYAFTQNRRQVLKRRRANAWRKNERLLTFHIRCVLSPPENHGNVVFYLFRCFFRTEELLIVKLKLALRRRESVNSWSIFQKSTRRVLLKRKHLGGKPWSCLQLQAPLSGVTVSSASRKRLGLKPIFVTTREEGRTK